MEATACETLAPEAVAVTVAVDPAPSVFETNVAGNDEFTNVVSQFHALTAVQSAINIYGANKPLALPVAVWHETAAQELRLSHARHLPLSLKAGGAPGDLRRRCAVCARKTTMYCNACKAVLCCTPADRHGDEFPCFTIFHTMSNFQESGPRTRKTEVLKQRNSRRRYVQEEEDGQAQAEDQPESATAGQGEGTTPEGKRRKKAGNDVDQGAAALADLAGGKAQRGRKRRAPALSGGTTSKKRKVEGETEGNEGEAVQAEAQPEAQKPEDQPEVQKPEPQPEDKPVEFQAPQPTQPALPAKPAEQASEQQ